MKNWTQADIDRLQGKPSSKQNYQALGRLKSGVMNNTEKKYQAVLEARRLSGEVLQYWFEPMNLKLADKCFYRVDFLVLMHDLTLEIHEVKGGYITDDGLQKVKIANAMFPFRFIMVQLVKKEWVIREF